MAFIKLVNKYLFSVFCKCVAYNSINDLVPDFKGLIIKLSKIKNSYLLMGIVLRSSQKRVSFLTIALQRKMILSPFYK